MVSKSHATGPIFASLILACLLSIEPAVADEPACLATERQPICTCDLTKLRPLQGAVGMKQVIYMENRIADDPKHGRRKLEEDPIKVVAGVGGQLFIIDHHHHAAEAWLGAKTEWGANALCEIVNSEKSLPAEFKTEDEFWTALKAARLVRLKNASGIDVDVSQLPKTLEAMPDDPYRSLAWFVRQKGGFCKTAREFAEFAWADWFRSKSPTFEIQNLPSDPNERNATVDQAVEMAHSSEAENLPGYSAVKCQ